MYLIYYFWFYYWFWCICLFLWVDFFYFYMVILYVFGFEKVGINTEKVMFRILNVYVGSSTFVYLSYFAVLICFFLWNLFLILILSFWSYFSLFYGWCIYIGLFSLFILWYEIGLDILRSLYDNSILLRVLQYCYIWFIISEICLFVTFFGSMFGLCLFVGNEFFGIIPIVSPYSVIMVDYGFILYWYYIDLFNILMNTVFLVFSGIYVNFMVCGIFIKQWFGCYVSNIFGIFLGIMFLWNQLYEFSILCINGSCCCFVSFMYTIELLHFTHVLIGVLLLVVCLYRNLFNYVCTYRNIFLYSAAFYWHFVDIVWFFLLRYIYLDNISILFYLL